MFKNICSQEFEYMLYTIAVQKRPPWKSPPRKTPPGDIPPRKSPPWGLGSELELGARVRNPSNPNPKTKGGLLLGGRFLGGSFPWGDISRGILFPGGTFPGGGGGLFLKPHNHGLV